MFEVNDTLDAVFLGAFFFGVLFSLASLLLGAADLGAGHGGDVGNGGGHDAGHDYLNISSVLAFIAWFGGVGYLAHNGAGWTVAISVLVAIGGGLVGGFIIYEFFKHVISPAGKSHLDPRDFELPGKLATVTSSILPGGVGEIVYEQSGARMVRPARSSSGTAIARGTEVIVLRAERGVGIVAPWSQLVDLDDAHLSGASVVPSETVHTGNLS